MLNSETVELIEGHDRTRMGAARPQEFFLERARVAMHSGAEFGPGGETSVWLNFATSPEILEDLLDRVAGAIHRSD